MATLVSLFTLHDFVMLHQQTSGAEAAPAVFSVNRPTITITWFQLLPHGVGRLNRKRELSPSSSSM